MFFAVPPFSTSSGKMVNAIFGVAKFFTGQMISESPDYLVFVRDAKGDNFRHEIYSEYKAQRERMPDDLRSQVDEINDMVNKMGFEVIETPGYEADDVIATLAKKYGETHEVYILTGDKDLHALVTENVKIYDTIKRKIYSPADTKEKFEVEPKFVSDYLGIVGDSSDNFPGIAGIGPKKAVVLINGIGTVEDIYAVVERIQGGEKLEEIDECRENPEVCKILSGKTFEKFVEGKELAMISKKLATLDMDVPLNGFDLEKYIFHPEKIITPEVIEMFQSFEFKSLLSSTEQVTLKKWDDVGLKVQIVADEVSLENLSKKVKEYNEIIFDTETTNIDPLKADLVGVSIFLDEKNIFYINVDHKGPQVSREKVQKFLKDVFESDATVIGHNIKYDLQVVHRFLEGKKSDEQSGAQSTLF